ncbi:MAG: hypothetical protein BGO43_11790 [Gammaproteobacteria bacterium 39-13]|nr:MAG: hypothetical protein BGO43_11790 [Gammaproteobacteria bacterium 39-13]
MILLRNLYYRDGSRKLTTLCLCLLLLLITLIIFLRYEQKNIPPPKYFATSYDGTPLKLVPLSKPNMQPNALLTWAVEASTSAYNINFVNYRRQIQNARSFFTRNGYNSYLKAIKESRNLDAVQRRKMIVYAKINGTPTIIQDSETTPGLQGSIPNAFIWRVQIPLVLTYENSNPDDKIIQNNIVTLTISRMSTLESPSGVGIDSFVIREVIQ